MMLTGMIMSKYHYNDAALGDLLTQPMQELVRVVIGTGP